MKNNTGPEFIPFKKNNSKQVTNQNVKHKTIKFLEDSIGGNADEFQHGEL